jgi:hypothetical protein
MSEISELNDINELDYDREDLKLEADLISEYADQNKVSCRWCGTLHRESELVIVDKEINLRLCEECCERVGINPKTGQRI